MKMEYKQLTSSGSTTIIYGKDINNLVDNVLLYRRKKDGVGSTEYNTVYNEVKRRVYSPIPKKVHTISDAERIQKSAKEKSGRRKISFHDAYRAAQAIADISAGNIVNQSEIERRASICANCPKISDVSDCMGCGAGAKITKKVLELQKEAGKAFHTPMITRQGRTGSESLSKMFCHHCGCSCLTLCVCDMKHIRTEDDAKNQSRPDDCWMKRGGKNFIDQI